MQDPFLSALGKMENALRTEMLELRRCVDRLDKFSLPVDANLVPLRANAQSIPRLLSKVNVALNAYIEIAQALLVARREIKND